jgi:hypothetical protein
MMMMTVAYRATRYLLTLHSCDNETSKLNVFSKWTTKGYMKMDKTQTQRTKKPETWNGTTDNCRERQENKKEEKEDFYLKPRQNHVYSAHVNLNKEGKTDRYFASLLA